MAKSGMDESSDPPWARPGETPWRPSTATSASAAPPRAPGAPTPTTSASSPPGPTRAGLARTRSATATCAATRPTSPSGGASAATVARKLAAIRAFYAALLRAGTSRPTPPSWSPPRSATRSCPGSSAARRWGRCSTGFPARTPLELRDRAMLELTYSCGLRAEEVVDLDTDSADFEGERLRVEGKGGKTRLVPIGEPAQQALRALPRARPRTLSSASARSRRCSSPRAAGGFTPPTSAAGSSAGSARRRSPAASRRTRCATPSRPTCSRAARTCARSRSCSGTRVSRPPRSTREWSRHGCAVSTLAVIRAPEERSPMDCR